MKVKALLLKTQHPSAQGLVGVPLELTWKSSPLRLADIPAKGAIQATKVGKQSIFLPVCKT